MRWMTAFAVVAAACCACGGGSSTGGPGAGVNVTGTWNATWVSSGGASGHGTIQLAQMPGGVTGTVQVQGSPCFANADVSGSISGDSFTGTMTAGGASAAFDLTVGATQMSGTYDVTSGGACTGDSGTLTASR